MGVLDLTSECSKRREGLGSKRMSLGTLHPFLLPYTISGVVSFLGLYPTVHYIVTSSSPHNKNTLRQLGKGGGRDGLS